jgi:glycosyltransferase involved in cell wall biosynthesis
MKIAIVSDASPPQVNGVVRVNTRLEEGLKALGHEVRMITSEGCKTFGLPSYPEIRLAWRPATKVAAELDAFAPDAVHIATEGPVGSAARAHCMRRNWAFTTHWHTRFPEYVRLRTGLPLRWCYAWFRRFHAPAARVMVPSASVRDDLLRFGIRNAEVLPNGVDCEAFSISGTQAAPDSLHNLQHPVFLYVGRLATEKNVDAFLSLDLPGTKVVCGTGPEEARLKAQHPEAAFLGVLAVQELAAVYRAADVFVFPSLTDTFGLVILEAMACGTPVAAFPVPGPIDVIGASGAGVMSDNLRDACMQALEVPRSFARAHALQFSWDQMVTRFIAQLAPVHSRDGHARIDTITTSIA